MTMKKPRTLLLFGAGAAIEWGGPSTKELTKLVREIGFSTRSNIKITEYIFQTLIKAGFQEKDVNFETIINVIEELIIHYSLSDKENRTPSLSSILFSNIHEDELLNFERPTGQLNPGGIIKIAGENPDYIRHSYNDETPSQLFFQLLFEKIISLIKNEISRYCYHTPGHSNLFRPEKEEINNLFSQWIFNSSRDSIMRMYSLNYEKSLKFLLDKTGMDIFEGFENLKIKLKDRIQPNLKRILKDLNSHIFYNLHGSVYWRVDYYNHDLVTPPEIRLMPYPVSVDSIPEPPDFQINKGEGLQIMSIITGYQKAVRTFVPPFRQMHAAFDQDCLTADKIYIIGYSFGDENINQSIKSAIKYNPNVKFIIVDPGFQENKLDYFIMLYFSPLIEFKEFIIDIPGKIRRLSIFDDKIRVFMCGFKEYLQFEEDDIKL
jgi:hypothetical protein